MSIERMVWLLPELDLISFIWSQLFSCTAPVPAFVGGNLLQSAFTGFCPLAKILKVMGAEPGSTFKY
jgi:hypothetical protein